MVHHRHIATVLALALAVTLSACGGGGGLFGKRSAAPAAGTVSTTGNGAVPSSEHGATEAKSKGKIWDLFSKSANPNDTVKVNKYIWNASLDVLNFLPIQSIDPFTGVIVTGYGTPPGGGRSYRATIYVQDPALDARSLKLSLQGSNGASVAPETVSAVEDAILSRARQLRIADSHL
ncbi:MAG: DUF3576 domain-containing protein [Cypionkella sp.]